jgi:riboflavin kinase/FMN adenylyltransferase
MTKLLRISEVEHNPKTVLTVGTFDGVHLGHRSLIETVVRKAKARNARSMVITFDPHPRDIINPTIDSVELLTTIQERAEIMNELGLDELVIIPFTRDFSLLSSREFVEDIVFRKIGVEEFVIGYDHQFGKDRQGSIETVEIAGKELGFEAYVVSKKEMGDLTISSSAIRRILKDEGNVEKATELLGRPLKLSAVVTHGDERGRTIGYPTANLNPDEAKKIIPLNGVYAVEAKVDDDWLKGMMNIGVRPTFNEMRKTLEVHILDFDEMIYGKRIQIRFLKRIRDEQKFSGVEELKKQLKQDEASVRSYFDQLQHD